MKGYHSIAELMKQSDIAKCSPGELSCRNEAESTGKEFDVVWNRMKRLIPVFKDSIRKGLESTSKSASGLVGGDAERLKNGKLNFFESHMQACCRICNSNCRSECENVSYSRLSYCRFLRNSSVNTYGGR